MVKISVCFHYIILFIVLCNEVAWHDSQIRQVSGNLLIVQCNLQIGQIGRLEGTFTLLKIHFASQVGKVGVGGGEGGVKSWKVSRRSLVRIPVCTRLKIIEDPLVSFLNL